MTYDSFAKHLFKDKKMDLCLSIGVDKEYDYNNPYCQKAKYKFFYEEPKDYADAFNYVMNIYRTNTDWRKLLQIPTDWLGGIVDKNQQPGSAAIGIFYRWWLIHNLKLNRLIEKYDWFIITRSDYFYEFGTPFIETLNCNNIYVPTGEDWQGICDRFMIVHRKYLEKAIETLTPIVTDPDKLYTEIRSFVESTPEIKWCMNSERYLKYMLTKRRLIDKVKRFPRAMYLVRSESDKTRWSTGSFKQEANMIVKYDSEYDLTINNKKRFI